MKIIALQAENIKRLVAVEIRPDGNLVQITGRNGQGKTSILDSIWWALGGMANVQGEPIRRGAKTARIRLDLGELVVTRTFIKVDADAEETTSTIRVTSATGAKFNTPQAVLSNLLSSLTFDPLEFARSSPRDQFLALRRFVPDVDFDAIDSANEEDFAERTSINRKEKESLIFADKLAVSPNCPTAKLDEEVIFKQITDASSHNEDIAKRKERRSGLKREAEQYLESAIDYTKQAEELNIKAVESRKKAHEIIKRLKGAGDLPEPQSIDKLSEDLEAAKTHNALVETYVKKANLLTDANMLRAESAVLTGRMDDREADKRAKITAAKMPVEGISFGKGCINYNDLPFEQASDAERLHVSVSIAMAMNPKLKVIRIRDGSLLDEESMAMLAKMADEKDFQVWVEMVDSSGQVGFVVEDGRLKSNGSTEEVS